jgi:hypothetical protein
VELIAVIAGCVVLLLCAAFIEDKAGIIAVALIGSVVMALTGCFIVFMAEMGTAFSGQDHSLLVRTFRRLGFGPGDLFYDRSFARQGKPISGGRVLDDWCGRDWRERANHAGNPDAEIGCFKLIRVGIITPRCT